MMRYLFIDFDGVINPLNRWWDIETQSVQQVALNPDTDFLPDSSAQLSFREKRLVTVCWSKELINRLNRLHANGVEIIWLTTWQEEAPLKLTPTLEASWERSLMLTTTHGSLLPQIEKWHAMLDFLEREGNPDEVNRILWLDDVVTRYFVPGPQRTDGLYEDALKTDMSPWPASIHPLVVSGMTGVTRHQMSYVEQFFVNPE